MGTKRKRQRGTPLRRAAAALASLMCPSNRTLHIDVQFNPPQIASALSPIVFFTIPFA